MIYTAACNVTDRRWDDLFTHSSHVSSSRSDEHTYGMLMVGAAIAFGSSTSIEYEILNTIRTRLNQNYGVGVKLNSEIASVLRKVMLSLNEKPAAVFVDMEGDDQSVEIVWDVEKQFRLVVDESGCSVVSDDNIEIYGRDQYSECRSRLLHLFSRQD